MNKKIVKALSLAMVVFMLFAMGAVAVSAAAEPMSLGKYPYPYPLEGNRLQYCGWNQKVNAANSVWFNDSETSIYPLKEKTNGYYEGWSTSNPVTTGTHHPYGVGMHSAINYAPSTVYSIDAFKMTSFTTTVFLVQYDMAEEEGKMDITPDAEHLAPIIVYLAVSADNGATWGEVDEETGVTTYLIERELTGKGNSVTMTLDADDLEGNTHIRMGVKTKHGIYEADAETGEDVLVDNTALASLYFADLYIEQSEEVPFITAPSIPMRPTSSAQQSDAYEVILPPMVDDNNYYGKPYGAWMAGENDVYYLSDMTYLTSSNTPNQTYSSGQPTTVNYPYGTAPETTFLFGAEDMEHEIEKGIGIHPKNPKQPVIGRTDSWTIYDISALTAAGSATPADTFYTLIGLTAASNEWGSRLSPAGVFVYIYGDKTGDGEHYELLAESEMVKGYNLGEFNVNIEGVKLLLIDVILTEEATSHGYSAIGLGNACFFMADDAAEKPDYSGDVPAEDEGWEEDDGTTTEPATTTKPTTTKPTTTEEANGGSNCKSVVTGATGVLFAAVVAGAACFGKRRREE